MAGMLISPLQQSAFARWEARLVPDPDTECEVPDREVGRSGVWVDGEAQPLYRLIWAGRIGPIPPGASLQRTCANKACVSPRHRVLLAPVEGAQ